MITIDDWGERHCTSTTCSREFCEGEICYAGLYQCPQISELAKALLPGAIESLEEFKSRSKRYYQNEEYDDEYYIDLTDLESKVNKYKRLAEEKIANPYFRLKEGSANEEFYRSI